MNDLVFNQPGAVVTDVQETSNFVTFHLTIEADACPHCRSKDKVRHGSVTLRRPIVDTHTRGKKAIIILTRYRYRCQGCGRTYMRDVQHMNLRLGLTDRLVEYIACEAPREPISSIAKSVGVSVKKVTIVVNNLIELLADRHRFETPEALGYDDLRLNRKLYTVITNAETGQAIGILPSGKAQDIADWIVANLDRSKIRFVVSDLAAVNIAVINRAWPERPRALNYLPDGYRPIHVADKFHVFKAAHAALTKVVAQELNRLRNAGGSMAGAAATLERLRPCLLKAVPKAVPALDNPDCADVQLKLPFIKDQVDAATTRQEVDRLLASNELLSRAFWATMRLHRLYNAKDVASARRHAASFKLQCQSPLIAIAFEAALNQFITHEDRIMNFFLASRITPTGKREGLTNNPTERRNGSIRRAWKSSRGISTMQYLRLRALYEPVDLRPIVSGY